MSATGFSRYLQLASIGTLVLGFSSLIFWIHLHGASARVLPAAAFLVIAPLLLRRQKSRLQFWFLSSAEPETKSAQRLAGRRNWEPVLWLIAYVMLWMWLLNVGK
jgi:hypothetical protein